MKKLAFLFLALLLAFSAVPALADGPWQLALAPHAMTDDFDGDETQETFTFSTQLDEYDDGSFTISVGDTAITQDGCVFLAGDVYTMRIGWAYYGNSDSDGYYATLFMVPEYGPSDDPYTYCYLYVDGALISVGNIPTLPQNMVVDPSTGIITTQVRAWMIGTWSRPADYILATGYSWNEEDDFQSYYHMVEVPRAIYPFGMIVSLKQDLPLMASQTDRVYSATLTAADNPQVILAATDDRSWLYVSSFDGYTAGWVHMESRDWSVRLTVGDRVLPVDDVFGDILYAD